MKYTIDQLNAARQAKIEARRNSGEDCGDFRGSVKPRPLPAPLDDDLEQGIAELVASLVFERESNEELLNLYLLENTEPGGRHVTDHTSARRKQSLPADSHSRATAQNPRQRQRYLRAAQGFPAGR